MRNKGFLAGGLIVAALGLAACGSSTTASRTPAPSSSTLTAPTTTALPTTTVAPTTTSVEPTAVAAPCHITQLRIEAGKSGAAAGNIGQTILFTNVGDTACSMSGYPGVAALDADGTQVAQAKRELNGMSGGVTTGTTAPVVVLSPGQVASAEIEGSDLPIGTATSCPFYPSFLITPPGETHSATVTVGEVGSNVPGFEGCVPIAVNPVVPGATGEIS